MKFLQPMLAYKWSDLKDKIPESQMLFCQPKLDGIRATLSVNGLLSRAGKPIVSCPHILEALSSFFEMFPGVVLDGELYNHELKHDFNKITSLVKKAKPSAEDFAEADALVQYHVYDVPSHEGKFSERHQFIAGNLDQNWCVKHVETRHVSREDLDRAYGEWRELGYEGQMVRLDLPYENKRSKSLLKRKEFADAEYPVLRVESGLGNWTGCAKRVVCTLPTGVEFKAGVRGTKGYLREVLKKAEAGEVPRLATVRSPNLTPSGKPRFGIVTEFHYVDREF